jgi:hypothetical protein
MRREPRPTSAAIPFVPDQATGYSDLAGGGVVSMNVVVDGAGAVFRRPGIATTTLAPSTAVATGGVAGLYVTNENALYVVGATGSLAQRDIYRATSTNFYKLGGGTVPYGLRGSGRPDFAETEMLVLIAGGATIQKIPKTSGTPDHLGGNPPSATHVIVQSNRVLANDVTVDRTKVRYSDVALGTITYAGHELWSTGIGGAGYFTAEARPDNVQAIAENTNEVFVFGTGTTQCFQPDPSLVFAPTSTIEVGLSAPYSVVKIDQKFLFLDQLRRFVLTDGRTFQVISQPIQRVLDEMITTSDCFGYRVTTGFADVVVWTFPSDGRTFAFTKGTWSQWSGFSAADDWAQFAVTAAASTPDRATCLVGLANGKIGQLSQNANTDLGDPIVAAVTTGYQNHNTDMRKHCKTVRLALRRGQDAANPRALLSWRDRPGAWQQSVPIDMGPSGDTEIVVTLRSLGVYRRRQWKFEFSGPETFTLASATEEFEILDT